MKNSTCRKIILHLLDCVPKSAREIADNIGESPGTVEAQLTRLASENICEAQSNDEVIQWAVRKDIATFAQLVQSVGWVERKPLRNHTQKQAFRPFITLPSTEIQEKPNTSSD